MDLIEWRVVIFAGAAIVLALAVVGGVAVWIHASQISRRMRLLLEQAEQQTQYLRDIAGALHSSTAGKESSGPPRRPQGPLGLS